MTDYLRGEIFGGSRPHVDFPECPDSCDDCRTAREFADRNAVPRRKTDLIERRLRFEREREYIDKIIELQEDLIAARKRIEDLLKRGH